MPGSSRALRKSWYRLSAQQALGLAMLIGAGACLEIFFIGYLLLFELRSPGKMLLITGLLTGIISGVLALTMMARARERYLRLLQWVEMMREMNHHTRNALEQINYSAYSTGDRAAIEGIRAAMGRIEWALREVLTQHGRIDKGEKGAGENGTEIEGRTATSWGTLHFAE